MTNELSNVLAELASKLGTSVEKLWPILVAKERFDSVAYAVLSLVSAIMLLSAARWAYRAHKEDDDEPWVIATALCVSLALALFVVSLESVSGAFYHEANVIKNLIGR